MEFEPNPIRQFERFTCIPNFFIDKIMKELTELELKIMLVLMRKIYGWHKQVDRISISQFEEILGSNRKNLCSAIKSLVEKGLIHKSVEGNPGLQVTYYYIKQKAVKDDEPIDPTPKKPSPPPPSEPLAPPPSANQNESQKTRSESGVKGHGGGWQIATGGGGKLPPTKERDLNKDKEQTNIARAREGEGVSKPVCLFSSENQKKEPPRENTPPIAVHSGKLNPLLSETPIPDSDKLWISLHFDDETIRNALLCAKQMDSIVCLPAFIKNACKKRLKPNKSTQANPIENRAYAQQFDSRSFNGTTVYALHSYVEISFGAVPKDPICLEYTKRDFKARLNEQLERYKIKTR